MISTNNELPIPLHEVVTDIYAPLRSISQRTVALYLFTLDAFRDYLGHEPTTDDLDELTVARFLAHRVRTRAPATAGKDRAQIRAIWEFLARRRAVQTWPTLPPINVPERVPEAWMTDEFSKLLATASAERTVIAGIPGGLWWRALLLLAYDTGERATALTSVQWRDIRGNFVTFRAETRKGRRRDIIRQFSDDTAAALEAIRGDREMVFPWPYAHTYLWTRLSIILKRARLPATRRDKFHKIRRTTASFYQAAGHSAQQLLDHSSPATTRKYLDPRIVQPVPAPSVMPRVG
jgi:integrase